MSKCNDGEEGAESRTYSIGGGDSFLPSQLLLFPNAGNESRVAT